MLSESMYGRERKSTTRTRRWIVRSAVLLALPLGALPSVLLLSAPKALATDPVGTIRVEVFSDYQCPACARYDGHLARLLREHEGLFELTFRHFPLASIHPSATCAALAAESARRQGAFAAMHALLFERAEDWAATPPERRDQLFREYAGLLGLDVERFATDYVSDAVSDAVQADVARGRDLGVRGTPTVLVNGEQLSRLPRSYNDIETLLLGATHAPKAESEAGGAVQ